MELGRARLALGDANSSIEELRRVAQANPEASGPQTLLFLAYLKNKNYQNAMVAANRVQNLRPQDPLGVVMAGAAYLGQGQREPARDALLKARARDAGDINANRNLAILAVEDGRPGKAIQYYQHILGQHPQHTQTHIELSAVQRQTGDKQSAAATLAKAVETNPSDATAHAALAAYAPGNLGVLVIPQANRVLSP